MSNGWLEREELQYLTLLSVLSIQDYQTFYTLSEKSICGRKSSTYIKGYICIDVYLQSKVYMNLAAAKLRRDMACGVV